MPIIRISAWPFANENSARLLIADITRVVHNQLGCPLDKITVYIEEILPSRWGDAGIAGDNPDFKTKSRRMYYDDGE
ncbi:MULTISPECIES: tautomerase family protein [Yersinia]|uniref:4-oxalocrotonate tautomerase n=1 Tax=Yersinia intermedia TaxID=631 RepID=A0A0H5LZK7_YERIN|nr:MULTISPECIES: tautomerase family protein [Yersinia]MCB5309882.1 tautomerase family protein [Yersinia massiliensis]CRY56277.1 4-oxalocrotonate tautomerase [Yersinia intermedia]